MRECSVQVLRVLRNNNALSSVVEPYTLGSSPVLRLILLIFCVSINITEDVRMARLCEQVSGLFRLKVCCAMKLLICLNAVLSSPGEWFQTVLELYKFEGNCAKNSRKLEGGMVYARMFYGGMAFPPQLESWWWHTVMIAFVPPPPFQVSRCAIIGLLCSCNDKL